jgi:hypothetical protein
MAYKIKWIDPESRIHISNSYTKKETMLKIVEELFKKGIKKIEILNIKEAV